MGLLVYIGSFPCLHLAHSVLQAQYLGTKQLLVLFNKQKLEKDKFLFWDSLMAWDKSLCSTICDLDHHSFYRISCISGHSVKWVRSYFGREYLKEKTIQMNDYIFPWEYHFCSSSVQELDYQMLLLCFRDISQSSYL